MTGQKQDTDILSTSVHQFIAATAAKQPTPGGGSVAGVVGALSVALGEMALNYTRGKKKFVQHEEHYASLDKRLLRARQMFAQLVSDDIQAYQLYRDAAAMEQGGQKDEAMQLALGAAINVPREATKLTLAVLEDFAAFADKCNPYIISDLTAAAALGEAVVRLCDYNVAINVPQLTDRQAAKDIQGASRLDLERAEQFRKQIEQTAA